MVGTPENKNRIYFLERIVIYYTSFIRHHDERIEDKCDKVAYKTSVIQYFSLLPLFYIKKKCKT
jgi:hypothetical protein